MQLTSDPFGNHATTNMVSSSMHPAAATSSSSLSSYNNVGAFNNFQDGFSSFDPFGTNSANMTTNSISSSHIDSAFDNNFTSDTFSGFGGLSSDNKRSNGSETYANNINSINNTNNII